MRNSWCKVIDEKIVDGPRAWDLNSPPDKTWIPHIVVDPVHTINDKWDGMKLEIVNNQVIETNLYSPKSNEQIASEIQQLKNKAKAEIAYADYKLQNQSLPNRQDWEAYKIAFEQLLNITELSWDHYIPNRPPEINNIM